MANSTVHPEVCLCLLKTGLGRSNSSSVMRSQCATWVYFANFHFHHLQASPSMHFFSYHSSSIPQVTASALHYGNQTLALSSFESISTASWMHSKQANASGSSTMLHAFHANYKTCPMWFLNPGNHTGDFSFSYHPHFQLIGTHQNIIIEKGEWYTKIFQLNTTRNITSAKLG